MHPASSTPHPLPHDFQTIVTPDRWLLWPAVSAIIVVAVVSFICGMPGATSFLLIPLSALGYLLTAIFVLVSAGIPLARRRVRKAISVVLVLVLPIALWMPINWMVECLHLGITAGFGAGQLGSGPPPDDRPFAVYDWSTGIAGGPKTFLIYDLTDEIALPLPEHKHSISFENGFGEVCAGKVTHLLGHYYVCTFD